MLSLSTKYEITTFVNIRLRQIKFFYTLFLMRRFPDQFLKTIPIIIPTKVCHFIFLNLRSFLMKFNHLLKTDTIRIGNKFALSLHPDCDIFGHNP